MKFLVDMPVTPEAVEHLGRRGHEALHAMSIGLATVPDAQILDVALRERCIVVTADLDYPRLLALTRAEGPGVILFRGGSYSDHEMLDLLDPRSHHRPGGRSRNPGRVLGARRALAREAAGERTARPSGRHADHAGLPRSRRGACHSGCRLPTPCRLARRRLVPSASR